MESKVWAYIIGMVLVVSSFQVRSQSYALDFHTKDFGAVKEWRNDTTWFYIQNTSSANWFVLPTFYHQEFQIIAPKGAVRPGQKIRIGLSYYTEETGKFALEAPVYISSESAPIIFKVKGKIQSFHPDALIYCPNLDPKDPMNVEDFLVIETQEEVAEEVRQDSITIDEEELVVQRDTVVIEPDAEPLQDPDIVLVEREVKDTVPIEIEIKDEEKKVDSQLSEEYAINNIVFLIDVSGSMKNEEKLESLKSSMRELVAVLRPQDKISIITYASRAKVVFRTTVNANKDSIMSVINGLQADGSSYGKDGLNMAYHLVEEEFVPSGNNCVILATDGKFNYSDFSENKLYRQAARKAIKKVKLSVIGFGNDMEALKFLKKLARFGNGSYIYVGANTNSNIALVNMIKEQSKLE